MATNGGSAFPIPNCDLPGSYHPDCGMTMRQWYKGKSIDAANRWAEELSVEPCKTMLGVSEFNWTKHYPLILAKLNGIIADAMLAEDAEHDKAVA